MTRHEALVEIAHKCQELDDRQLACALPPLHGADMTWEERSAELWARVHGLGFERPTTDLLAALGAHIVAYMRAIDLAEEVDIGAGGPA
jgi:hypothetical protein